MDAQWTSRSAGDRRGRARFPDQRFPSSRDGNDQSVANVLPVFGVWAALSGAAQLVSALRRRAQLGNRWPMLLAGSLPIIAGVAYVTLAVSNAPRLVPLVLYTATGGVEFVVQAWLLARRHRRQETPAGPILSVG